MKFLFNAIIMFFVILAASIEAQGAGAKSSRVPKNS